jgi:predicted nucleic acid-binding protein
MLSDVNDEMVLETALNGGADAIVTFNQRDFQEARREFGCAVILPREALAQMRRSDS